MLKLFLGFFLKFFIFVNNIRMSFTGETNLLVKNGYSLTLNLLLSLPSIAMVFDIIKNNNIDKKNKKIIFAVLFLAITFIFFDKNTKPLGLILSMVALILINKNYKKINLFYKTLFFQNLLIGILMIIQYMLR